MRAHFIKKAQKDYPQFGVKKGESYYWWKPRFGVKQVSKTPPTRAQLTSSEFLKQIYELQDRIGALSPADQEDLDSIESEVQSIAEDIRSLSEEQSDKLSNMPEGLQQGSTGELLQSRADSCDEWASNLEGVDFSEALDDESLSADLSLDGLTDDERKEAIAEARQEKIQEVIDEVQGFEYEGE